MKPNEVTDERFFLVGNRGAIFANNEAHIARKGHHPDTLCGRPMLHTNYYPGNEHLVKTICSHCEDEYKQATGTKDEAKEQAIYEDEIAPGLRSVKVELTPEDIKFLMAAIECAKDQDSSMDGDTVTLPEGTFQIETVQDLQAKLEQAADESIVGD